MACAKHLGQPCSFFVWKPFERWWHILRTCAHTLQERRPHTPQPDTVTVRKCFLYCKPVCISSCLQPVIVAYARAYWSLGAPAAPTQSQPAAGFQTNKQAPCASDACQMSPMRHQAVAAGVHASFDKLSSTGGPHAAIQVDVAIHAWKCLADGIGWAPLWQSRAPALQLCGTGFCGCHQPSAAGSAVGSS